MDQIPCKVTCVGVSESQLADPQVKNQIPVYCCTLNVNPSPSTKKTRRSMALFFDFYSALGHVLDHPTRSPTIWMRCNHHSTSLYRIRRTDAAALR